MQVLEQNEEQEPKPKRRQGFACMPPEKLLEICSRGGKEAHRLGTAHKWTSETAALAGKKGGLSRSKRKSL